MDSKEILFRKVGEKYVPVSDGERMVSVDDATKTFGIFLHLLKNDVGLFLCE